METEIYYTIREMFRDTCYAKEHLLIDEYEGFQYKIKDAINSEEITENLSFNYDSILDYSEELMFELYEGS